MFPASYFTPRYFPSDYYAEVQGPAGTGLPPRDCDVYAAIRATLAATGAFADVVVGHPPAPGLGPADRDPLCVVTPRTWREDDDPYRSGSVRHATFSLTLIVRSETPWDRLDRLDRLAALTQNRLSGSDLGCGCLPALTRVGQGCFDRESAAPEQRMELSGQFSYLVPDLSGRSTSS